jgi:putative transposase
VSNLYFAFKHLYGAKREKIPKRVTGLEGVYSLKRLSEAYGV